MSAPCKLYVVLKFSVVTVTIMVIVVDGMWPPGIHVHVLVPGICITLYDKRVNITLYGKRCD